MNRKLLLVLIGFCFLKPALADTQKLPSDFINTASKNYKVPLEFSFCSGGAEDKLINSPLNHYPVIMICANKRTKKDWFGENDGNAKGETNVYDKFIQNGFSTQELWLYQYTKQDEEMKNMESLTDGLKWFIYTVLSFTKSNKVQILAHAEGAVLAQATIKKYNLYNLIHAVVYIAGPFHGTEKCNYIKALTGAPVCSNLAVGSDFLQDICLPSETPYKISKERDGSDFGIKYMTIYNGQPGIDYLFQTNPNSPALLGADNYEMSLLNHDGLRCSDESSKIFIPFLSDQAIKYNTLYDKDKDGFMGENFGGIDCNDGNALIFPGAPEIPGENNDRNCDGMMLLPRMGKDCLEPIKK